MSPEKSVERLPGKFSVFRRTRARMLDVDNVDAIVTVLGEGKEGEREHTAFPIRRRQTEGRAASGP